MPSSPQADVEKALECMTKEFLDRFVVQEQINKMQRAAEMVTLQETMEKNLSDLGVNLQNMFMELFDRSEERVNILEEEFAKGLHEMRTLASTARPSEREGPPRFNTLSSQTGLNTPRSDMTRTLTVGSTILRRLRQSSQDVRSQLGDYSVQQSGGSQSPMCQMNSESASRGLSLDQLSSLGRGGNVPVVEVITLRDPKSFGIRLESVELSSVIDFLHAFKFVKILEPHQPLRVRNVLEIQQVRNIHWHARSEGMYLGTFLEFVDLEGDDHFLNVMYHMVRARNRYEYKSALAKVKFDWDEGTAVVPTLASQFMIQVQDYTTRFQEVVDILNVHSEEEAILPLHATNRYIKDSLISCYLDGFPNKVGSEVQNTLGWRIYHAECQLLNKRPEELWRTLESFTDDLQAEVRMFWMQSKDILETMRVFNGAETSESMAVGWSNLSRRGGVSPLRGTHSVIY